MRGTHNKGGYKRGGLINEALYREGGLLYRRGKVVKANVMEEFLAIANTILLGSHTRHLKQNKTFNRPFYSCVPSCQAFDLE